MNIQHLRALVEVIRTGSIAAAARQLYLSAPAVTKQIKALEGDLNVLLFDRVGHRLVPRQEGHMVYRRALEMFRQIDALRDDLPATDGRIRGHVTLGCGAFAARSMLPHVIAQCRRDHPHVRFSISEYSRIEELHDHFMRGDFRLLIGLDWLSESGLIFESLFTDELVLIAPQDHPLAKNQRRRLEPKALTDYPMLGHAYPRVLFNVFQRSGLPADFFQREQPVNILMRNTETLVSFVEKGLGVALVPYYMVRLLAHRRVAVRRFTQPLPLRFGVYCLPETSFTAAECAVIEELRRFTAQRFKGKS